MCKREYVRFNRRRVSVVRLVKLVSAFLPELIAEI